MKTIENQRNLSQLPNGTNAELDCNTSFVPTRCPFCNQRLFDVALNSSAEIQMKCPRCSRTVNLVIDEMKSGAA